MSRKRKLIIGIVAFAVLATVWLAANPAGRFGWCGFGFTTYDRWPRPLVDFQVRADGSTRSIAKTHQLTFEHIEWLLESEPEVLIIALGWDGVTTPDERIRDYQGCEMRLFKNKEAIELFNRLKVAGKRVAMHYHSTC